MIIGSLITLSFIIWMGVIGSAAVGIALLIVAIKMILRLFDRDKKDD